MLFFTSIVADRMSRASIRHSASHLSNFTRLISLAAHLMSIFEQLVGLQDYFFSVYFGHIAKLRRIMRRKSRFHVFLSWIIYKWRPPLRPFVLIHNTSQARSLAAPFDTKSWNIHPDLRGFVSIFFTLVARCGLDVYHFHFKRLKERWVKWLEEVK